jgi:hypothetical protein
MQSTGENSTKLYVPIGSKIQSRAVWSISFTFAPEWAELEMWAKG